MSEAIEKSGDDRFDLVVAGGRVLSGSRTVHMDVGIRDGRITALLEPGSVRRAHETLDASHMLVMPGAIDSHVHFREPGLVYKEGFASGSAAAAVGGVTTVMVMPTDQPWTLTASDFEIKRAMIDGQAWIDIALQAAIAGDLSNLGEIDALAEAGAISFELFLGDVPAIYTLADNELLLQALERIAATGLVAGVSPADDAVIASRTLKVQAGGGADLAAFYETRPPLSETLGVARACVVAAETGARVHLRQMSTRSSIALLRNMKSHAPGLTGEVTPHNLELAATDVGHLGPFAKVLPPLRTNDDLAAAWEAVLDGTIDIVATDHAPHAQEEKESGRDDIWKAPGGFPGVQNMVPILLDAASRGRLSYEDIVRLVSETPARLFGLSSRKGRIEPGHDADLIIVDPLATSRISNDTQLSKARVTPFDGRQISGTVTTTILRGRVVARDGEIIGTPMGALVAPDRTQ